MIHNQKGFGYAASGAKIGESWLSALSAVMTHGDITFDEGRKRLSLQSFRIKAASQIVADDSNIADYGDQKSINSILELTFAEPAMVDIDVNPSFEPGSKSYYARIKDGKLLEYAAQRLSTIPESKKAVIVFPTYDDYARVLENPWNDYLPCIVAVQFRMTPNGGSGRYKLNTIFFARSLDIFQKGLGNFVAISKMAEAVAEKVAATTGRTIELGFLEGFITDVHVYEECFGNARKLLRRVKSLG